MTEVMDATAKRHGRSDEWPCLGRCDGQWHPKANMDFVITERAAMLGVKVDRAYAGTGMVPMCRECGAALIEMTIMGSEEFGWRRMQPRRW